MSYRVHIRCKAGNPADSRQLATSSEVIRALRLAGMPKAASFAIEFKEGTMHICRQCKGCTCGLGVWSYIALVITCFDLGCLAIPGFRGVKVQGAVSRALNDDPGKHPCSGFRF